jgi:hypothetical protein
MDPLAWQRNRTYIRSPYSVGLRKVLDGGLVLNLLLHSILKQEHTVLAGSAHILVKFYLFIWVHLKELIPITEPVSSK